jgi:hypothetical protein
MENETVVETKPLPVPESIGWRFFYSFVVTVLAILCFTVVNILKPEYQSGKFEDYVNLFLSIEASWVFLPLIAYSSACLLLIFPASVCKLFWVRSEFIQGIAFFQYVMLPSCPARNLYIVLAHGSCLLPSCRCIAFDKADGIIIFTHFCRSAFSSLLLFIFAYQHIS